jgi:hypothetical protein
MNTVPNVPIVQAVQTPSFIPRDAGEESLSRVPSREGGGWNDWNGWNEN